MRKVIILFSALVIFQGCSSVSQPVAQRPLVEHQYSNPASSVSPALANALESANAGDSRTIKNQAITFGHVFFAASGLHCRKALRSEKSDSLYCKRASNDWYQVSRVISEYSETNTAEAK
ncbi:hypothetical protein OAP14_09015 [Aliiglaciecola sp.]|nr:hypothetical protein [Aliiglaciecola sp.]